METTQARLFYLPGIVANLNSVLARDDIPIELSHPIAKRPRKDPFSTLIARVLDRQVEGTLKFRLTRTYGGLVAPEVEVKVGYILVEKGCSDLDASEETNYEALRLVLTEPVKLKSGKTIPESSHKLYVESSYGELDPQRRSHVKLPLGWRRADYLKTLVPTEWFFREGTRLAATA